MKYTSEMDKWLSDNWNNYRTYQEVVDDFNKTFSVDKNISSLLQHCVKQMKLPKKGHPNYTYYSKEEEACIRELYYQVDTYKELARVVNEKFHNNRTTEQLRDKCTKYMGLKGHMKNMTTFAHKEKEQLPLGTIRRGQNGCTYIKVMDVPKDKAKCVSGYQEPYWLPIQKKIYQDAYGEIPSDKMVVFLDGNYENLSLDNLYCTDRKVSMILSSNRWWSENKELTLTAIKWAELFYTIKNKKEKMYG